jgi:hypothetical protein
MKRQVSKLLLEGVLLLGIGVLAVPAGAQNGDTPPGLGAAVPADEPRTIYVPLWAEPLGKSSARARGEPAALADAWWASVPLGARGRAPERESSARDFLLKEFRRSSARQPAGAPRHFVAVVRVNDYRPGSRPVLEVIDPQSGIESRAWGRLVGRSGAAADFLFDVREPLPAMTPVDPVLRREMRDRQRDQRFQLQLALNSPSGPQTRKAKTRP